MVKNLVSVVIPTYNRAQFLIQSVESVLTQTYKDIEILIVDDGSTDNTEILVKQKYSDNEKVKYLRQKNRGAAAARNYGIREARGEFFALLDSDDLWKPEKLERQIKCMRKVPEAGIIWTDMETMDGQGNKLHPRYLKTMYQTFRFFPHMNDLFKNRAKEPLDFYYGDIYSQMVLGNLVHTSTLLVRKSVQEKVGYYRDDMLIGEDFDYHLRLVRAAPAAFLDEASIRYRIGQEDALSAPKHALRYSQAYLKTLLEALKNDRDRISLPRKLIRRCLSDAYFWVGREFVTAGKTTPGLYWLIRSILLRPFQPLYQLKYLVGAILPWFVRKPLLERRRRNRILIRA